MWNDLSEFLQTSLSLVASAGTLILGVMCIKNKQYELAVLLFILMYLVDIKWFIRQTYYYIRDIQLQYKEKR